MPWCKVGYFRNYVKTVENFEGVRIFVRLLSVLIWGCPDFGLSLVHVFSSTEVCFVPPLIEDPRNVTHIIKVS